MATEKREGLVYMRNHNVIFQPRPLVNDRHFYQRRQQFLASQQEICRIIQGETQDDEVYFESLEILASESVSQEGFPSIIIWS